MRKINYKSILIKSSGLIIIIILLWNLDLYQIYNELINIKIGYFIAGLLLFLPMFLLKSLRWLYLLNKQSIHIIPKESLIFYASGLFLGSVTPGRIGEIIRVYYIKNKGYSSAKGLFTVFVDRLLDIISLLAIGYFGTLFLLGIHAKYFIIISLAIVSFIGLIPRLYLIRKKVKELLKWLINFLVPVKNTETLLRNVDIFMKSFQNMKLIDYLLVVSITLFSWVFYYLEMYIFTKALGLEISFLNITAIVSVTALVALIPITIAGIGTRDAALVLLFSQLNLSKESAIAFSSLLLLRMIINTLVCSIGWFLNKTKKSIKDIDHTLL